MEQSSMRAKSAQLGSRHPKVVIVYGKEENVEGVADVLNSHVEEYRSIPMNNKTTKFLTEAKPSVILFALNNVATCIEYYANLIEESVLKHTHYTVLLCSNKESSLAFRCCMKGLFDNYFVYQPLYEKFRLAMIVHNGIARGHSTSLMEEFNEDNFEQIDEHLAHLIDEGSRCKQDLLQKLDQSRDEIITATENYQPKEADIQKTAKELMSEVAENHVKPLLNVLENDIKMGLDSMITQLMNAQLNVNVQAKKSKGLLQHQPSIKSKAEKVNNVIEQALQQSMRGEEQDTATAKQLSEQQRLEQQKIKASQAIIIQQQVEERSKRTILVVEDNALYRDMLVNVLRKEHFNVDEAEDGLRALQKIKDHEYDLIIMDLFMPKLDGLNTTKKIRQASGGKDMPVIALTGNKSKEIIRKWASYGLKGYIIKPSTKDEIMTTVNSVFAPKEDFNI